MAVPQNFTPGNFSHWRRKWQATLVFLLENPIDRGAWQVTVRGVARVGHDLVTKPPSPPVLVIDIYPVEVEMDIYMKTCT